MEEIYEKALHEAGVKGRFHNKYCYVYNFFFSFSISMAYMNLILVLAIPRHHCRLPEIPENATDVQWKSKYLPKVSDSYGKLTYSSCTIFKEQDDNNVASKCTEGYEYDKTWYDSTAVTAFNWVCDKELNGANVLAYSKISEVIGSFIMGWFGDAYGRKLSFLGAILLMVSGRIISIVSTSSYVIFIAGCVIAAFPSLSATNSIIVLSIEVSRPEDTKKFALSQCAGWILGSCTLGLMYWWIRDWWWFFIITNIPLSFGFIYAWSMIESPKWLLTRGENKRCIQQLQRVAKSNKGNLQEATKSQLLSHDPPNEQNNVGPLAVFSSCNLALNTTLLLTCWVSTSIIMTTIVLSSTEDSDGANPFVQYIWQALMEMPGYLLAAFSVDRIGRRWTAMIGFSLSGLLSVSSALRLYVKSKWVQHWLLNALILGLSKSFITVVNYAVFIINMELYPVCLRQTGMAIGGVLSNAAATLPAYIIYLGRNHSAKLPGLIMAFTAGLGLAAMFFLPETMNAKLPDTLEEARVFGKGKRKYFSIPTKPDASEVVLTSVTNKFQDIIK